MSKVIEGNLLNIKEGLLVHQVNTVGIMGAGMAQALKEKWPIVFDEYRKEVKEQKQSMMGYTYSLLGSVYFVRINEKLIVANLFGQNSYGRENICYTDYKAHDTAWHKIGKSQLTFNLPVYAPFLIGAGLAGGDWKKIHEIAERYIPNIIWVKYKGD